ncbi:MAG: HIT domain-containing protein [Weeping tea tree witches'-broom phytoplasma]|uniref:HIT family protein n=1 Tax=Candidatus Phytoplasma melaleucae TaxID=2982630 RepID=UPI00293AB103|nr:HIT domain-containing protein [Weeping tea tree witches'-broom phytoplasma]
MATIFSNIIQRKIPSYIIYEDNLVIAFLDISQVTKGHTLVITKQEYSSIIDVPNNVFVHLCQIVHRISQVLMKTFKAKGFNLLNNNGEIAGQKIPHCHIHIIPRYKLQEVDFIFKNNMHKLKSTDYEKIQNDILNNWN